MDGSYNGYAPYTQAPQSQQHAQHHQSHQQQQGLGSFGNLNAQNHQQQDSPRPTTLPPLQGQNGFAQFGSMSFAHPGGQSHTPTTPHTPGASSNAGSNLNSFAHQQASAAHNTGNMLPPNYNQHYSMPQSMMYAPNSTGASMPPTTSATGLPTIRPMPPGGVSSGMAGLPSLSSTGQIGQQPSFMQNEEAPTHVVGSQGRRGILPSAPGRPNPPAQGTAVGGKTQIPSKDADGKYPCPHCNKTYLHAKHLKRHLLRHTGDRPYMCHLCKDTFSRSDILKRHFQKCSIRRGNPTGANHLAHQRRNTNGVNRLSVGQQDAPIGLAGLPDVAGPSYQGGVASSSPTVNGDMSARTSRANSIIVPGSGVQRNGLAGLGILGSNAPSHDQMASSAGYQGGMAAYAMPNGSNPNHMQTAYAFNNAHLNGSMYNNNNSPQQMSFLGQQSSRFDPNHNSSPRQQVQNGNGNGNGSQADWSRMFNPNGQDGFIGSQTANANSQGMNYIKQEEDSKPHYQMHHEPGHESFLGSLYSHPGAFGGSEYIDQEQGIPGFPSWGTDDPLQGKVDSLREFCFPDGVNSVPRDASSELMKACLTVENVKHFAEHYISFHGHWPTVHMPTFKVTEANNGLVLAMICIGAVYSDRLNVIQVRQMMDFVKRTVIANSSIYQRTMSGHTDGLGESSWDVEEMQALQMLATIFTWHGDGNQRQSARSDFLAIVKIAKAMSLTQTAPPGHYAYSVLHSGQNSLAPQIDGANFDWHGWLQQETRNRVLYQVFLTDAAMVMFFNTIPQLDPLELRLMLPADDAAWDARDSRECANALGLNGLNAQNKNLTGTRRPKQPGMREAMRTLLEPNAVFQPSATNVYAKFVLVHALITRIIACQRTLLVPDVPYQGVNFNINGSGPATPLSQNDWLEQHGRRRSLSAANSGHATPTDGFASNIQTMAAQGEKKRLSYALDKFKRCWDADSEIQYPPGQLQQRRFGFSRDGVHFFYLGRSFLQSQRASDWCAPPDLRFNQVMALLKRIKMFVIGDNETKGQDIGSVGDIDEQYGLDSLTLDMKLLFKPYNSLVDSAVTRVQTH